MTVGLVDFAENRFVICKTYKIKVTYLAKNAGDVYKQQLTALPQ